MNKQSDDVIARTFKDLGLDLLAVSDPLLGYRMVCTIKRADNLTKDILLRETQQTYSFVQDFEMKTKERQKNESIMPVFVANTFPKELTDFVKQNEFPVLKKIFTREAWNYSAQHPVLIELETCKISSFRKWKFYMWLFWGRVYKWPDKHLRCTYG